MQIHFISASCENMIDGKGMRPGDILTSASGKTVEVRRVCCPSSACHLAELLHQLQASVPQAKAIDDAVSAWGALSPACLTLSVLSRSTTQTPKGA